MDELYRRIQTRRTDLKMSQAELAEKLGYKDRSTIAKIERGVNDISQSRIAAFADALHTTPSYLMGWTDDPYNYDEDEDDRLCTIPSAQFEHLKEVYDGDLESVWHAWCKIDDDHYDTPVSDPNPLTITDSQIKAAFFNGADPSLTKEEQDEMWAEAKAYIDFKIQQKKRKENQ